MRTYQGLGKIGILHDKLNLLQCRAREYGLVIFAGDNGVSLEHTSIYPAMRSTHIVDSHLHGTAPTAILLERLGKREFLVDVGLHDDIKHSCLIKRNIRKGSRNFLDGDALTHDETTKGIDVGRSLWEIVGRAFDIIGVGEIGIADTLCAAAIATVITGLGPETLVIRGSRDYKVITKKVDIISKALQTRYPDRNNVIDVLARFGGLEIAALTGFISRAAEFKTPIMLDGYVTEVAALLASYLDNRIIPYLIVSSASGEGGQRFLLARLGLDALFDLNINYGEGLAAVLGLFLAEFSMKSSNIILDRMGD